MTKSNEEFSKGLRDWPNDPGHPRQSLPPEWPYSPGDLRQSFPPEWPYSPGDSRQSFPPEWPYSPGDLRQSFPPEWPYSPGDSRQSFPPEWPYSPRESQAFGFRTVPSRSAHATSPKLLPPDGTAAHRVTRPSRAYGSSLWRFDGNQWKLMEDHSVAGGVAVMPVRPGNYVGQMVKIPSRSKERDDSKPRANAAADPVFFAEVVHRALSVPGYASESEIRWLAEQASHLQPGALWIELGAMCGRSLLAAGLAMPLGSKLITVDERLGQQRRRGQDLFDVFRELSYERSDLSITMMKSPSVRAADHIINGSAAVIYIDANHHGPAVRADIAAWRPKLRAGGLMCGHDYGRDAYPGVAQVVDQLPGSAIAVDSIWTWRP
ncbi:MAG: class I SAM-dependent methyltransferase [Planctomycetota bacterium]